MVESISPQERRKHPDYGEPFVRIHLPYSDLQWVNEKKLKADYEAIENRQIPPSFTLKEALEDEDWIAKDENGDFMPGHIDESETIYPDVYRKFKLQRLEGIKQLAFLQPTTLEEKNIYHLLGEHFHHTRFFHSLVLARTLELMMRRNHFQPREINLAIASSLVHDLATPAYGDPTKEIDPEALDEEKNLEKFFLENKIGDFTKYGFTNQEILHVVKNEGTIGKLLDIADKIAYTATDIYFYSGNPYRNIDPDDLLKSIFEPINATIRANPKWANIFNDVNVNDNGEPYFTDVSRLGTFLELRSRMHVALYLNPHCRGLDMIYKLLLTPLYSREPDPRYPLNPKKLRTIVDRELAKIITDSCFPGDYKLETYMQTLPDFKRTDSRQIENTIEALESKGKTVIGSETIRAFNTGSHFLAVDPVDGKIKPYRQVNPSHHQYLERLADSCNSTVVYYLPEIGEDSHQIEKTMKSALIEAVGKYRKEHNGSYPHLTIP